MNRFLAAVALTAAAQTSIALAAEPGTVLRVIESQRYCDSARQCTLVYTRCDSCGCGVAIRDSFAAAHNRNLEALCASYDGAHCDKLCPIARPMCVMGLCIMQPNPSL